MAPSTLLGAQESWAPQSIGESSSDAGASSTRSSMSSGSSSSSSSSSGSRTECITNARSQTAAVEQNRLPRKVQELTAQVAPIDGHSSSSWPSGQRWPNGRPREELAKSGGGDESSTVSDLSARQKQDLLPETCDEPLKQLVGRDELANAALVGSPPSSSSSSSSSASSTLEGEGPSECFGAKRREPKNNKRQHDDHDNNIESDCCPVSSNLSKSGAVAAASSETSAGPETIAGHASNSTNSASGNQENRGIYRAGGRDVSDNHTASSKLGAGERDLSGQTIELRFLVRRREAGALIGKRGSNIKRLRESFRSSMFSIPDTGNGPERVVCIATDQKSMDAILTDLTQLLMEKSPENDEQIELKLLIHSSHAGSIIGIGGQSIKKLRNDSRAAIKIYEMCCPLSNERVCAIKAKPPVVVSTIKLVLEILSENPIKGTVKPYDALYFDLGLIDKYGGYPPDEASLDALSALAMGQQRLESPPSAAAHHQQLAGHHYYHQHQHQHQHEQAALASYTRQLHEDMYSAAMAAATAAAAAASNGPKQHYSAAHWRSPAEFREPCELSELTSRRPHGAMADQEPSGNLAPRALKKSFNNCAAAASSDCQGPAAAIIKRAGDVASECDDHQHLSYPPQHPGALRGRFHPYAQQQQQPQHHLQQADSFLGGYCAQQQQQARFHSSYGPFRGGHNSTHCGAGVRLAVGVHGLQNQPPEGRCSQRPSHCMCSMQLPMMAQSPHSLYNSNNNNHHHHHHPHHHNNSGNNHHHPHIQPIQQRNAMAAPTTSADVAPTTNSANQTGATTTSTTSSQANSIVSAPTKNLTTATSTSTQHGYNNSIIKK